MASLRFLLGLLPETAKYEFSSDKLRSDYIEYKKYETSEDLRNYESLERKVTTSEFRDKVKAIKSLRYKKSYEYSQEKEYLRLLKSKPYLRYQKLRILNPGQGSPEYLDFKNLENSLEAKRITELESIIKSDKFQQTKRYLSLSSSERFSQSEEYEKLTEYERQRKSEKVLWYKNIKKKYPFSEIEKWDVAFEEKFESGKVDQKKWMNRYLYGDKLLKKGYVLGDDIHAFTEGKNLEIYDRKLRIITRREKAKSLVWNPALGFYEREFEFTSDLLSSANGYRNKYGIYEAKVRIADSGVTQAFSLMSDQIVPHIDIFKFSNGKLLSGNFWQNGSGIKKSISSTRGVKYTKDFYIYSLEWQPGKLVWRVNGVIFKEQTTGLPDNDMFMVFNSSLKEKSNQKGIPSIMEIDWIRVYTRKQ